MVQLKSSANVVWRNDGWKNGKSYQTHWKRLFGSCVQVVYNETGKETDEKKNVRRLFHGTKIVNIDVICEQGFDWRMAGSVVGALYGKGTYFARDASYSKDYTNGGKMFLAQVCKPILVLI